MGRGRATNMEHAGAAMRDQESHQHNGQHKRARFERVEIQRERLIICPCNDHTQWHDEQRNLRGTAHSDAERQIHLVLPSEYDGGRVPSRQKERKKCWVHDLSVEKTDADGNGL